MTKTINPTRARGCLVNTDDVRLKHTTGGALVRTLLRGATNKGSHQFW